MPAAPALLVIELTHLKPELFLQPGADLASVAPGTPIGRALVAAEHRGLGLCVGDHRLDPLHDRLGVEQIELILIPRDEDGRRGVQPVAPLQHAKALVAGRIAVGHASGNADAQTPTGGKAGVPAMSNRRA